MTACGETTIRWIRKPGSAMDRATALVARGAPIQAHPWGMMVTRNVARRCLEPLGFEWRGRAQDGHEVIARLVVPCRGCESCQHQRRREWIARALRELAMTQIRGKRSWFITLTVAPQWRHRATVLAQTPVAPWADRPTKPEAIDRARRGVLGDWLTLYLKRVRELAQAEFRFLAALETHQDGEYHLHVLGHETAGEVGERIWRDAWKPTGFAQAKLVRSDGGDFRRTAAYVAKYMTKQSGFPRTRASLAYGQGGLPRQTEVANTPLGTAQRESKPSPPPDPFPAVASNTWDATSEPT